MVRLVLLACVLRAKTEKRLSTFLRKKVHPPRENSQAFVNLPTTGKKILAGAHGPESPKMCCCDVFCTLQFCTNAYLSVLFGCCDFHVDA